MRVTLNCEDIIIGGDFNLVLDTGKDKKGGLATTHQNSLDVINAFCENEGVVDVWRVLNPDSARFTWPQKRPCYDIIQSQRLVTTIDSNMFVSLLKVPTQPT